MEKRTTREYSVELRRKLHRKQIRKLYVRAKDYDGEYNHIKYDISFWARLCRKIGANKVLELGVGSGQIAIPLSRMGIQVTGIDISLQMLERARHNKEKEEKQLQIDNLPLFLRYPEDMTNFNLETKDFDLVFIGINTFFHLLPDDRGNLLKLVSRHLKPKGVFGIGVFNIDEKIRRKEFGNRGEEFARRLVVNQRFGNLFHQRWDRDIYDPETKILRCDRETKKWIVPSSGVKKDRLPYTKRFNLYVLPPGDMKSLLSKYFEIDYQLSIVGPFQENHFWICRKFVSAGTTSAS